MDTSLLERLESNFWFLEHNPLAWNQHPNPVDDIGMLLQKLVEEGAQTGTFFACEITASGVRMGGQVYTSTADAPRIRALVDQIEAAVDELESHNYKGLLFFSLDLRRCLV